MTKYAAFLRGVNVGGVNLKMAEVAAALDEPVSPNVKTILASGNVLLESRSGVDSRPQESREGAARRIRLRRLGAGLRPGHGARDIRRAYPFEREVDGHHSLRHVRHRRRRARRTRRAGQGRRSGREDRARQGRHLLAGAQRAAPWTPRSARRWARSATSRRPRPATCERSTRCCDEHGARTERLRPDRRLRDRTADAAGAGHRGAQAGLRSSTTRWRSSWSTRSTSTSPSSATPDARTWRCARWPSTTHTRRYLVDHPSATVVALAEGLQTSFYRLDASGCRRPVPLADSRSAADHRAARQAAAAVGPGDGVRAVGAGLQLDGPGRPVRRGVHHRRGAADVPAARTRPWG